MLSIVKISLQICVQPSLSPPTLVRAPLQLPRVPQLRGFQRGGGHPGGARGVPGGVQAQGAQGLAAVLNLIINVIVFLCPLARLPRYNNVSMC